jgi:hypothetical protein
MMAVMPRAKKRQGTKSRATDLVFMAAGLGSLRHCVRLTACCGDPMASSPTPSAAAFSLERCIMSDALKQAEHYRDLEKRYLHLAEIGSSTKRRSHYLRMADHYGALADAEELSTLGPVNIE